MGRGLLTTVRRLIARSNAIWTGNDRSTEDATVRTGFVRNLANPLDIVLECCRPEVLALHLLVPVVWLFSISSSFTHPFTLSHPSLLRSHCRDP